MSVYPDIPMKEKSPNFTPRAQQVIKYSKEIALEYNRKEVSPIFLFLGILNLRYGPIRDTLAACGVDGDHLATFIAEDIVPSAQKITKSECSFSESFVNTLQLSSDYSETLGHDYIGIEHIFLALLDHPDSVCLSYFSKFGASINQLMDAVHLQFVRGLDSANNFREKMQSSPFSPPPNAKDSSRALDAFALNYNSLAQQGKFDSIIGREHEVNEMVEILCRRKKNNPLLLGEAGVGKTALVEGLAQRIISRSVPEFLSSKQIYALDLASMVAGTKYRGQFEDRLKKVLTEVKKDQNIILFIDEIHTIIGAGSSEGGLDTANILKPPLSRGEISCIGATTNSEYKKHFSKDAALGRRYECVEVKEPSTQDTLKILEGTISKYENYHGLLYEPHCLKLAVDLSQRYMPDRRLPDKAIDLIDQSGARVKVRSNKKPKKLIDLEIQIADAIADSAQSGEFEDFNSENSQIFEEYKKALEKWVKSSSNKKSLVKPTDLYHVVSNKTHIPYDEVSKSESKRLLNLESTLNKKIIGQSESVKSICKSIIRNRCGLGAENRPIGCFLLLGSTGSGKTHTAKILAESVFGGEEKLIRFDMTEYSEKISSSRLTGASPGYIGYEEGGQLTESIRRQPYSVVLFDEIEKAHPEVIQTLLQIMDDGILTDNFGKTANFTNSIIILTGNIGSDIISNKATLGFQQSSYDSSSEIKNKVKDLAKKTFKPEFINRLDEIVVYKNFSNSDLKKIARVELNKIKNKLIKKGVKLNYTKSAVDLISELAAKENLGARPIKRILGDKIENLIANYMLSSESKEERDVTITKKGNSFLIK